ncbi:MAG: phosphatase PAP2 family protein [Planctomycetota bacterium]
MPASQIAPDWDPNQFAGLRRWSLLLFVTGLLFLTASRIPLFHIENNLALQAWESFYSENGQATPKRWPQTDQHGVTFDQQMILEVRTAYDPGEAAPTWLHSLRRFASLTTHLAEGYAVVALLLIMTIFTRMKSSWRDWRGPVQGAFLGAITAGVAVQGLKILIGRGRPNELIYRAWPDWQPISLEHSHHSLPSGHSTAAGVMVTMLCVLFPRLSGLWILLGIWLCATRVLTAEHWPSDTIPGFLLGALCSAFWISRFQRGADRNQRDTSSQRPLE